MTFFITTFKVSNFPLMHYLLPNFGNILMNKTCRPTLFTRDSYRTSSALRAWYYDVHGQNYFMFLSGINQETIIVLFSDCYMFAFVL